MRTLILVLLLLTLLGGCVAVHYPEDWTHAGVSPQTRTADEVDCDRVSRDAAHTPDLIVGGVLDLVRVQTELSLIERAYSACMRSRGYSRA